MSMIYCHKCGKLVSTRAGFCGRCGEKIDEKASAERELIRERRKQITCFVSLCAAIISIVALFVCAMIIR